MREHRDARGEGWIRRLRNRRAMIAGNFERRLEWLPHLAAGIALVVGLKSAPKITADTTQRLSTFFATGAGILATLLVAAALFQGLPTSVGYHVRRFLGPMTFTYLGVGIAAAAAALTDALPVSGYRYVFALTLCAGAGALVAVLLAGAKNIAEQRDTDVGDAAQRMR
jgi:hypothetical protein